MNEYGTRLGNAVVALALVALHAFPLLTPQPGTAICVWVAVFMVWCAADEALELALRGGGVSGRSISVVEVVPFVVLCQVLLDCQVAKLGSSLVLFGNLAAIGSLVRGSSFPYARIVR